MPAFQARGVPLSVAVVTGYDLSRQLIPTFQSWIDAGWDVPLTYAGEYPSLSIKRAITYSKGALFLAHLREAMGERAFWAALARYTRRFAGQSASTSDFQRVLAAEADGDLTDSFAKWAYGPDGGEAGPRPLRRW